ncbi:GIY-YIG nuclease family protein [Mycobacterium sp. BMJ-28]
MDGADKAAVIAAIQRLAEENGGVPVGRDRFIAETGLPDYYWQGRYWLSWSDAVREAGYVPNAMQHRRHTDDDLLRHLALLASMVGRFPTNAHLRMERGSNSEFPSANVFGSRLGTKPQQVQRLREFIARTPEFANVAALLPAVLDAPSVEPTDEDTGDQDTVQPVPGYVYLMRSGKFHKIGRSNDHGRRAYEIGLQLPEKLEVVHTIETDDAVGIERYWHDRFRDRRRNGEWFMLSRADIAAFKRRRSFM